MLDQAKGNSPDIVIMDGGFKVEAQQVDDDV